MKSQFDEFLLKDFGFLITFEQSLVRILKDSFEGEDQTQYSSQNIQQVVQQIERNIVNFTDFKASFDPQKTAELLSDMLSISSKTLE